MATSLLAPQIDNATKLRFAKAFLRTNNASTAAMETLPYDIGVQLQLARSLPTDPDVLEAIDKIKEEQGDLAGLPSKGETARLVMDQAKKAADASDWDSFEKLTKLYASIMGHIERPGTNVNVDARTVQNVLIVPSNGTDAEWEKKAADQQSRLILNAIN